MSAHLGDFAGGTQLCIKCGYSHAPNFRRQILRRLLASSASPHTVAEIAAAWPCFWGPSESDNRNKVGRALYRDLHGIGAVQDAGSEEWRLP